MYSSISNCTSRGISMYEAKWFFEKIDSLGFSPFTPCATFEKIFFAMLSPYPFCPTSHAVVARAVEVLSLRTRKNFQTKPDGLTIQFVPVMAMLMFALDVAPTRVVPQILTPAAALPDVSELGTTHWVC